MNTMEIGNDMRKVIAAVLAIFAVIMLTFLLLVAGHAALVNQQYFYCNFYPIWYWPDAEQIIVYAITGTTAVLIAMAIYPPGEKSLLFRQTECYACGINIRMHYGNHTRACLRKLSKDMQEAEAKIGAE
jgi:hypothetical protein